MTSAEQLKADVKSYAKTLNAIVSGIGDYSPEKLAEEYDTDEYDFTCQYNRLKCYFDDVADVEFRVDASLEYKGAIITLACGGPNIWFDTKLWFDTKRGTVYGVWSGCDCEYHVYNDTCEAISDY